MPIQPFPQSQENAAERSPLSCSGAFHTCSKCGAPYTAAQWSALEATSDWVIDPGDGESAEVLEGRQCATPSCHGTMWRAVTVERRARERELASLVRHLRDEWVRKTASLEEERERYSPWAPPGGACRWLQARAARRYRLALWVLEQTGTVLHPLWLTEAPDSLARGAA